VGGLQVGCYCGLYSPCFALVALYQAGIDLVGCVWAVPLVRVY